MLRFDGGVEVLIVAWGEDVVWWGVVLQMLVGHVLV